MSYQLAQSVGKGSSPRDAVQGLYHLYQSKVTWQPNIKTQALLAFWVSSITGRQWLTGCPGSTWLGDGKGSIYRGSCGSQSPDAKLHSCSDTRWHYSALFVHPSILAFSLILTMDFFKQACSLDSSFFFYTLYTQAFLVVFYRLINLWIVGKQVKVVFFRRFIQI